MRKLLFLLFAGFCIAAFSCEKFLAVDPPVTNINGDNVLSSDAIAISAVTGLYAGLSAAQFRVPGGIRTLNLYAGLYTDELSLFQSPSVNIVSQSFYKNALSAGGSGGQYWNSLYGVIYRCNSLIEGLQRDNGNISEVVRKQLLGELMFFRALHYYYLISLYGDVALVTSTDYIVNSTVKRRAPEEIIPFLIANLNEAKNLLSPIYLDGTLLKKANDRFRPTSYAAAALLTKIFLLKKDWVNAEAQANEIIAGQEDYVLDSLNAVFLITSREAIWQVQEITNRGATEEGNQFIMTSEASPGSPFFLNPRFLSAFEVNDRRRQLWVGSKGAFFYPYKYKIRTAAGIPNEALTIFRLADIYLSRAEARARNNQPVLAMEDLNKVRVRSWLPEVKNLSGSQLLDTILHERQVELFTEFGNRFIDLKRFGKINQVMPAVCAEKGTTWKDYFELFPLLQSELNANPNLKQNGQY
ncbi:RagB/SusD family nutrient uptake outer membrane protein [Chitinophaga lutea]